MNGTVSLQRNPALPTQGAPLSRVLCPFPDFLVVVVVAGCLRVRGVVCREEKKKKSTQKTRKKTEKTHTTRTAVTAAELLSELPPNFLHAELSAASLGPAKPGKGEKTLGRDRRPLPSAGSAVPHVAGGGAAAAAAALPCGRRGAAPRPAAGLRPPLRTAAAPAASHRSARQEPLLGSGAAGAPRAPRKGGRGGEAARGKGAARGQGGRRAGAAGAGEAGSGARVLRELPAAPSPARAESGGGGGGGEAGPGAE